MSFRRRNYLELMDNVLTRMVGGVAAESYPFPPARVRKTPHQYPLENPPVKKITSVYGLRNGQTFQFGQDVDFELINKQTLQWKEGAAVPDKGTTFQVNYLTGARSGPLNDIHVGSVARTLLEATALEMAGLYAQLESVYKSAFVDTATGSALENVVALLGMKRVKAGRNSANLVFTRVSASSGSIFIPAGTRVLTADAAIEYATTQDVSVVDGQQKVKVPARDVVENNQPVGAGQLTLIAKPIAGIEAVTNEEPSTIADADESDEQLRNRAKSFLHGSERATLGSIKQAIARQGILADVTEEGPGVVKVVFHEDAIPFDQQKRIEKAVDDVRPAGIFMDYDFASSSSPQAVDIELRITTPNDLLEADLRAVQEEVRERVADYFAQLEVKAKGSINRVIGLVLEVPEVTDVRILGATVAGVDVLERESGDIQIQGSPSQLGDLIITDPNLPTTVFVTATFPKNSSAIDKTRAEQLLNADFSYLNDMNAVELGPSPPADELARRQLSFGKLLLSFPLPGATAVSINAYDAAVGTPAETILPTAAALGAYTLQWVFVNETGESTVVSGDGDGYALSPFERLTLASVEIKVLPAVEVS